MTIIGAFVSFRRPSEFPDAVDLIEVASVVSDIFSFDIEIFILIELNAVFRFAISKCPTIVSTDPDIWHEGSHTVMQTKGIAWIILLKPPLFAAIEQDRRTDVVVPVLPKNYRSIAVNLQHLGGYESLDLIPGTCAFL